MLWAPIAHGFLVSLCEAYNRSRPSPGHPRMFIRTKWSDHNEDFPAKMIWTNDRRSLVGERKNSQLFAATYLILKGNNMARAHTEEPTCCAQRSVRSLPCGPKPTRFTARRHPCPLPTVMAHDFGHTIGTLSDVKEGMNVTWEQRPRPQHGHVPVASYDHGTCISVHSQITWQST